MKRIAFCCLVILTVMCAAGSVCAQVNDELRDKPILKSDIVDKVRGGQIDWGNGWIYATGQGALPLPSVESNRVKALLKARDYAKSEAIANLLMAIKGTTISYEATGGDYMAKDIVLKQTIEGYVKNVDIQSWIATSDLVTVTVGAPLYGQDTAGSAFISKIVTESDKPAKAVPLIEIPIETSVSKTEVIVASRPRAGGPIIASARPSDPPEVQRDAKQEGPFDAVLIDTRGYDVLRSICPKIRKEDGSEVWGTVKVDYDEAIENGIVSYSKSLEKAKENSRYGKNPLIVRAVGRGGGKAMCDPIISDADAKLMLAENAKTKFLDGFKVIFVTDPTTVK